MQASILEMPSHHDGTLRGEIAHTVSSSVRFTRTGVQVDILSSGRKMPDGKASLPEHADDPKGWAHPVWGHGPRRRWHWTKDPHQVGKPGWFEDPIASDGPKLAGAMNAAVDDTRRYLGA